MPNIIFVRALPDWKLEVRFDDGTAGIIDLKDRLFGEMFEPLRDIEYFTKVELDEFGAPTWLNGADLAPDAIYDDLRRVSAMS